MITQSDPNKKNLLFNFYKEPKDSETYSSLNNCKLTEFTKVKLFALISSFVQYFDNKMGNFILFFAAAFKNNLDETFYFVYNSTSS